MLSFLIRRAVAGIVLVLVVVTVTFLLLRITGSDPARAAAGQQATAEQVAEKSRELGLDRPLVTQYGDWLSHAVRGDFGTSWFTGDQVGTLLGNELPVTLSVVLVGLVLAAVVSAVAGVAAAVRGGWLDKAVQLTAVVGAAIPSFLVALVLALFVGVRWKLLPATGYVPLTEAPLDWLRSVTMPAVALAILATASMALQIRGSMLDVLEKDFIRTLRSRGLSSRSLLFRHALRNAAPPALTVLALLFIGLLGGSVVVERVFGLSGLGSQATTAASQGDQPIVLGVVVVTVVLVVVVNILLDIARGLLDPKVRVR
ncbi:MULTISPECIES: ABC transporter permease [unclassified Pseudofrankia]|uniref:ABC transporter permease n=1 Tax=unclassified Pseudofrankia TaxID=2994372 RepID=UPI0008D92E0A|nr:MULTISPECIES: ABC transporter permease [unclassified Pseudofrankia]MDT3442909.1 ABC transporter permease [Pseudofrankia sp. BMG5.37]OHV62872.1 ABC transporter permease [Pseudofrankia sp. BMG5.36]